MALCEKDVNIYLIADMLTTNQEGPFNSILKCGKAEQSKL